MPKIDYKRNLKRFYQPSAKEATVVDLPAMNFLTIDGAGDPNTSQRYKDAVGALFSVSYALKFLIKKKSGIDYGVMPLEGLWWMDDGQPIYAGDAGPSYLERKDTWKWTMMIMQPEEVAPELFEEARVSANRHKSFAALAEVRFEVFHEGSSVQILHVGPFANERPTIKRMDTYMQAHGLRFRGKHHEIYLSDFTKTAPEKLETIIRHPFE